MGITLPAAPAALPVDTYAVRHRVWWEQCDVLLRQEDQRQRDESEVNRLRAIAANEAHAKAQQATADAMMASAQAQQAMAAALASSGKFTEFVFPPKTKADLVFEMVQNQPQSTVLTPGLVVDGAIKMVDAYLAKYPNAVAPPVTGVP